MDKKGKTEFGGIGRWLIGALVVAGVGYWYFSTPNAEQRSRESVCKNWGFDTDEALSKCRASNQDMNAVIAPKLRQVQLKEALQFNIELSNMSAGRTLTQHSDYQSETVDNLSKQLGGIASFTGSKSHFDLEGRRFKLTGRIVTETPDTSDSEGGGGTSWQPQTFELWRSEHDADSAMVDVHLDIESLNRSERKFIQDHCDIVSGVKTCVATVWGHVGFVSEEDSKLFHQRGLIVDQIDFQPIDTKHLPGL